MNISQIRAFARSAFGAGQRQAHLARSVSSADNQAGRQLAKEFDQKLVDLDDVKPIDWQEAERISDVDTVDEAFRDFVDDPTADAATILVQRVVAAYLKG